MLAFLFNFGSIRFGFQFQLPGLFFSGFGFCSSPQWRRMQRVKHPKDLKLWLAFTSSTSSMHHQQLPLT